MMNKRAPRRSNEEWHQIILAARASALSDFEYCRDNSIPRSTFYRTLTRLRKQACELPVRSERPDFKQEVVPINISELPVSREDRILGGGTLELINNADTALVASILSMLNSRC